MSFVNINYSTLEDAWGENFNNRTKKAKAKKPEVDPVCALYGKRYTKASPPYARRRREDRVAPTFETDEEYRKYYGYTDARVKKVFTAEIPSGYITEEEYVAPKPRAPKPTRARRVPRKPVYVDEPQFQVVEDEDQHQPYTLEEDEPNSAPADIDAYLSESEEEEEDRPEPIARAPPPFRDVFEEEEPLVSRTDIIRERMYLEMGLFTISGILMIFMMEQFIQIGMKLKPANISA